MRFRAGIMLLASLALTAGLVWAADEAKTPSASAGAAAAAPMPITVATNRTSGQLSVSEQRWDFGYAPQNAQITHRFTITNAGHDSLFISRIKPSCGCTSAPLVKSELAPGESMPVDVTFSTRRYSGPVSKTVQILSSDPAHSPYAIQFQAQVGDTLPTLSVEPADGIDFDRFDAKAGCKGKVTLTNHSADPLPVHIVASPREYLAAALSKETIDPGQSVELEVESNGTPPLGRFSDAVTLVVDDAANTRLTVPIKGICMTP